MSRKAFTLVELLATIAILAIISVLFIPSVMNVISDSKTKVYKAKEEILVNAAKDYTLYNRDYIFPTGSNATYITINTLVTNTFMSKILDDEGSGECNGFVRITVNSASDYNYEPCLLCPNYTTNISFCNTTTYNNI